MTMLVVDLSNNNGACDFAAMKAAGISAVWLKASEGAFFKDATFHDRRVQAGKAGLRVGAYHFARPDVNHDPETEAISFCTQIGTVGKKDLRPVLDYERLTGTGVDEPWIRGFNKHVRKTLGVGPLFYSYPDLISHLHLSGTVGYGLWLASYGRDDGVEYPAVVPAPWKKMVAHQFSSHSKVAGCPGYVDLSRVLSVNAVLAHPVAGRL